MAGLLETLGRKQLQLEEQDESYTSLITLLARVVSGEVNRNRVLVNLTDRTWTLSPEGERPGLPATINGLPQCVVCPELTEGEIAND